MSGAPAAAPAGNTKLMAAVKIGAATGLTAGVLSVAGTGGRFIEPFVLLGGVSTGVHYFMAESDDTMTSLVTGAAAAGVHMVMGRSGSRQETMKYALIAAGVSFVGQKWIAPEVSAAYTWVKGEYNSLFGPKKTATA